MRLLLFINSLQNGGAERVLALLANYWAKKGWNVTILTLSSADNDFYHLGASIKRISLDLSHNSSTPFEAVFNNIKRISLLRQWLKELNPDVGLSFMTTSNCLLALASIGLNIKVIGSERSYPPLNSVGKQWHILRKWCYGLLDCVVGLTQENVEWLYKYTKTKYSKAIPNPVIYPLARHSPILEPANIKDQLKFGKILVTCGRLTQVKGYDRLIDVFADLTYEFKDWGLVILGEGDLRPDLERQAQQKGISDRVIMPGSVGNVGDWLAISELFVLSSYYEGFPNVLVEALAHGVPAVSFDCLTGPNEIISHGVDGYLVENGNLQSLFQTLYTLMTNDGLRAEFAENAKYIRDKFDITKVASIWESIFCKLMGEQNICHRDD